MARLALLTLNLLLAPVCQAARPGVVDLDRGPDDGTKPKKNCRLPFDTPSDSEEDYVSKMKQGKPGDPLLVQMASVANRVYNWGSPTAGWDLALSWDLGEDTCKFQNVGIYTKQSKHDPSKTECVLAFQGATYMEDMKTNLPWNTDWCGFPKVHNGFAKRLNKFIEGDRFKEFKDYLSSNVTCGGGVSTTGHSSGGALSTLMAACANSNSKKYWVVDAVYTFGAPPVSKQAIVNPLTKSSDGCFKGYRVYNSDNFDYDPIPAVGNAVGFRHPRIQEIRIKQVGSFDFVYKSHGCTSEHARTAPTARSKLGGTLVDVGATAATLHGGPKYVERLLKLYGIYRGKAYADLQSETAKRPTLANAKGNDGTPLEGPEGAG